MDYGSFQIDAEICHRDRSLGKVVVSWGITALNRSAPIQR